MRARLERPEQGISFTEFSYMLLQAYDFLHLFDDARLPAAARGERPVGQHHHGHRAHPQGAARARSTGSPPLSCSRRTGPSSGRPSPAPCGSTPTGRARTSSTNSSSAPRTAWWATYLRYFTFLDHDAIRALDAATAEHPERREAQRALARAVCTLVHGEAEAARAEAAAQALYSAGLASLDEAIAARGVRRDAHLDPGPRRRSTAPGCRSSTPSSTPALATSKSQARTLVTQGGVYVNDRREQRHRRAPRARRTCSSTATSSCARGGTTISSASSDESGDGARG